MRRPLAWLSLGLFAAVAAASCQFDRADRWLTHDVPPPAPLCQVGDQRCGEGVQECQRVTGKLTWVTLQDCKGQGLVCVPDLLTCKTCVPNKGSCKGQVTQMCDASGDVLTPGITCEPATGSACRSGACVNLCVQAGDQRSNVGCEYWAVDLDNANVSASLNAASQQFAVVISNPQPDVSAKVSIEQDDSLPGETGAPLEVATATIPPLSLRVFKLGPREVDGSPEGKFDAGSHTALSRHAYRVTSDFPVVAYQFNPLENVNVFSNDASLLKPVEALTLAPGVLTPSYVVLGWPQTIASTDDPKTNFNANDPTDLRAFLTIVGTRPNTTVRVKSSTAVIGGGPVPHTAAGGEVELTLQPFDVLNLETDDFNADFTGSLVSADQPVVVFSGSEASDAPFFPELSLRRCCADHLEEQLDPVRTAGKRFVASVSANRTRAVAAAGATIGIIDQPEYFRVIAATDAGAKVTTTLDGDSAEIDLGSRGDFADITTTRDFMLESNAPVMLSSVSPSQEAAGIPRGLPGGDPSLLVIPPVEQFRSSYVFLTPDKYSFDFIRIVAPPGATIVLDGQDIAGLDNCVSAPGDGLTPEQRGSATPPFLIHRCQLSFPVIDPDEPNDNLSPGLQDDGVHRIDSDFKIGVLVDGFDAYVSYAYAAGTELTQIVPE